MSKLICLLLVAAFSSTFADLELENLAQKVLELLNPHGSNGNHNSLLLSLTNGEHLSQFMLGNSTHKISLNVTFSGQVSVSAQRDTKKVQLTSQWGGGAGLAENEQESKRVDLHAVPNVKEGPMNHFLGRIYEQQADNQRFLAANEMGVLLFHGADTSLGFRDKTRQVDAKLKGAFVVGSTTKVSKNF